MSTGTPKNFWGIFLWKISYEKQSEINLPGVWNREAILKTRQDKTRQDKTRQDKTRQEKTRQESKNKESKNQRIKESKNQRIKESKNQRIKESKNQRIKEFFRSRILNKASWRQVVVTVLGSLPAYLDTLFSDSIQFNS
jgi:hypothetical protein